MCWTFHLATKLHLQNKLLAVMGLSSCSFLWFQHGWGPSDDKNEQCRKEVQGEMVSENQAGKLEAFLKWGEKGWEWVRDCQPSSPPRSRWFHTSLLSPGTCSPTVQHPVHWHPERQRSLGENSLFGCETWKMSHSVSAGHSPGSGIQASFASPVHARGAAGMRGSDRSPCNAEQKLYKEVIQLHQPLCIILGDIWRKQGSRTVCSPPSKSIQISSAVETAGILSLPFFRGSSTESRAFAYQMTALSFHLGASCLAKLIENITPLWPKNESLAEQRHPAVKNEHWKQWSCQFSYQDANKYWLCQAGSSAGPLV